jgi:4-hydroxy-tetrahydrodipicolinate reductase
MGVAVLAAAVRTVAGLLGSEYECSIVEAHHSKKKDAPSGTALRLAKAAREGGSALRDDQILAVRGGDVIGEHTVRFAGSGEYIEMTHRATSRDLFAMGALRAARWIAGRSPGWYTMEDVLGVGAVSRQDRG